MSYTIDQFLTIRACTGASLSPCGGQVAFLSTVTGRAQVWCVAAESGWPRQVTFGDDVVRGVAWSPGGDWLGFTMDTVGDEHEQLYRVRPEGSDCQAITAEPEVIFRSPRWSPDGASLAYACNRRDRRHFDLWLHDLASGEERLLHQRDASLSVGEFSPDGRRLTIGHARGSLDSELFVLDLESGAATLLLPHDEPAVVGAARWLADGSLLCLSDLGSEFVRLLQIDPQGGDPRVLVEREWDLDGLAVAGDGETIAYTVNAGGRSELWVGRLGDLRQVDGLPEGIVGSLSFDRSGARLAFDHQAADQPPDIWRYDCHDGRLAPVTRSDTAGIPRRELSAPELVAYPTFDGRDVPAWWYRPGGEAPNGGWPAVVLIHGGPESQTRCQFNPTVQYLVHRGYAVLAPNVRGSTGYGRRYHQLDNRELRPNAVRDAAEAVPWLAAHGVDRARIAVMGQSYGGFMVLALVTGYPELWAAGIDLYGVANFESFFARTGIYRRHLRATEYGDPERDAELLRELSPVHRIDRIGCPMMVVQGATDPRVPQHESDQIVAGLRARGVPVEYLVFANEGHGITRLENKITAFGGIARFLDEHLGGRR